MTLFPEGFVLIPEKFVSTDAENPLVGAKILSALDTKSNTFELVVTPT